MGGHSSSATSNELQCQDNYTISYEIGGEIFFNSSFSFLFNHSTPRQLHQIATMTFNKSTKRASETLVSRGEPETKKFKLLDDSDSEDDVELTVNAEFAKRYEHNKARAEKHRLEEKYGKDGKGLGEDSESSSESEDEDEDGELVNEVVDAEISATLQAIRAKDPRIYAEDAKFYTALEQAEMNATAQTTKDKPLYLRDYHRQNLLNNGSQLNDEEEGGVQLPYVQEQEALKSTLVKEFGAADKDESGDSDEDEFLVKKTRSEAATTFRPPLPDPTTADQNPEHFLSNFFASRAWVSTDKTEFEPLESEDEEERTRAEEFEIAWNHRFEDPETSNKTLTSHSREIIAKYSVRREELTGRKKIREREKQKKLEEKKQRDEGKKRLKILKVAEMEEKLAKIKEAAGLKGKSVDVGEWADLLEGDWNDDEWNAQMQSRFGNDYYEEKDNLDLDEEEADESGKVKKPKWEDDLDIKDLVPDFVDELDPLVDFVGSEKEDGGETILSTSKSDARRQAKRDRRILEALADQALPLDLEAGESTKDAIKFRYRETSPTSFGLTTLDILAADDAQLNQFVGLKKLAHHRPADRKEKDKKKLSKKARLRAWRKETFGNPEGPELTSIYKPPSAAESEMAEVQESQSNIIENGGNAKKRKRKNKTKMDGEAVEA